MYMLDEDFIVNDSMTTIWHVRAVVNEFKKDKEKSDAFFISLYGKSNKFIENLRFKNLTLVTKMMI